MSRTVVVIPPSPPWWHSHRRGHMWMLCTDLLCEKPYDLDGWVKPEGWTES